MTETNNNTDPNENKIQTEVEPAIEAAIESPTKVIKDEMTIGKLLRSRREEKGLNLKVISQQTKVHVRLLELLENNQLDKLPSKTYVRGFVKSVAKILGINQDEAMAALNLTYGQPVFIEKKELPPVVKIEKTKKKISFLKAVLPPLDNFKVMTASYFITIIKVCLGIILLGFIGFNVKNLLDRNSEERLRLPPVLSTVRPKVKLAPKSSSKPENKNNFLETTDEAPLKINLIQDKKENENKTEIVINDITLKSVSNLEKQFAIDTSMPDEKINELFPARYKVHVTKGVENIFINAVEGDSWITYKVDDKEIKKYVLRQGRTVFLRGEKIRLFLGNTKSLKIFYNNKPLALSTKSNVKNLIFPDEIKSQYMIPLFVFLKDSSVMLSEDYIKNAEQGPLKKITLPLPITTPSNPINADKPAAKPIIKTPPAASSVVPAPASAPPAVPQTTTTPAPEKKEIEGRRSSNPI